MISITNNIEDIVLCWQEAFGDSREEIVFFVENSKDCQCLAYYENGKICSMLFLVDCRIEGKSAKYIYAACTLNEYKNRGIMTKLLEYVKKKYAKIVLIPAEEWLIDYYMKRGFTNKVRLRDIVFSQCNEITEYLYEGCTLDEPFALCYLGG